MIIVNFGWIMALRVLAKIKAEMKVIVSNHNGFAVRDMFSKYLLFEPSGLIGKIKIEQYTIED